ncbi:hypothetical protein Tco_0430714, partial [Tanacetum coccineum]
KLKSVLSLTPKEQEAAEIMKTLKESRKSSRRQPGTRGLNEGTSSKSRVPIESTVVSATSRDEQDSEYSYDDNDDDVDKEDDTDDEGDDHISDT